MSEMVERVARAVDKVLSENFIGIEDPNNWPEFIPLVARAALEAMRPSEDFVWDAVYSIRDQLDCVKGHDLSAAEALKIFNAVIDAALRQKP